jgi:peptidoglycan/LPS O-acetylase OafA/YrhL
MAAWLVLASHAAALRGFPSEDFLLGWTRGGVGASHLGLAVFFVLSGHLVAASAARCSGAWDFATRRVRRIAPGWIACCLLVVGVLGPLVSSSSARGYWTSGELPRAVVPILAGSARWDLPGVFLDHPLRSANGSLWTIPYEVALYGLLGVVVFGFLRGRAPHRWGASGAWLLLATLLSLPGLLPDDADLRLAGFRVVYLLRFSALFLGGWALHSLALPRRTLGWLTLPASGIWIATWGSAAAPGMDAFCLPVLVVWLAGLPAGPLARVGDISYGYYLWGWPVQQTLIHLHPSFTTAGLLLASSLATLLPATLSWLLVERRFLRRTTAASHFHPPFHPGTRPNG